MKYGYQRYQIPKPFIETLKFHIKLAFVQAWVVGVYTGEIGSDAEVKIKLHGDRGSSEFLKLDDNRDNYVSNR